MKHVYNMYTLCIVYTCLLFTGVYADDSAIVDIVLPVFQSTDSIRIVTWDITDTDAWDGIIREWGLVDAGNGDFIGTISLRPDSTDTVPTGAVALFYRKYSRADVDHSGAVNVADLTELVQILFYGATE